MELNILDFLIGFFLMNAMPHVLFGKLKIRFLSGFGFGDRANLAYAAASIVVVLVLFHIRYGIQNLLSNGIVLGAGTMILIYFLTITFFHNLFRRDRP